MKSKVHVTLHIGDIGVILWWFYITTYTYIITYYPVSAFVLKSTLFLGIYLTLRVLLSMKRVPGDVLAALVVLWSLISDIMLD